MTSFPKTLYITKDESGDEPLFYANDDIESLDHDAFVGVYELRQERRAVVQTKLVATKAGK